MVFILMKISIPFLYNEGIWRSVPIKFLWKWTPSVVMLYCEINLYFKCIYICNNIIFYAAGELFRKKQIFCYVYHILLRKALLWLVNIVFIYFMLRKYGIVLHWMCTFRRNCCYHFRGGPCCKGIVFHTYTECPSWNQI